MLASMTLSVATKKKKPKLLIVIPPTLKTEAKKFPEDLFFYQIFELTIFFFKKSLADYFFEYPFFDFFILYIMKIEGTTQINLENLLKKC